MEKLSPKQIELDNNAFINKVKDVRVPEGFVRTLNLDFVDYNCHCVELAFISDDVTVKILYGKGDPYKSEIVASGHTNYKAATGWYTFDRRGVNDSFYVDNDATSESLFNQISEQIVKARAKIEAMKENIIIPGIPGNRTLTPATLVEIKKKLKSGKSHTLYPGGMGVAYELTTKSPGRRSYGTTPAKRETCDFFEVKTLFLIHHDHD